MQPGGHRCCHRHLVIFLADRVQLAHAPEDVVAPAPGAIGVHDRVEARRRLGKARDHGDLGDAQLIQTGTVVDERGGLDAVGPVAEKDFVEIELQNVVFCELCLNFQRQEDFVDLAHIGFLAAEKEIARHLHGDGAASGALFTGANQVHRGPGQALPVDPGVLIEALVLGRNHRFHHELGDLLEFQRCAALLTELRHQAAVPRVNT